MAHALDGEETWINPGESDQFERIKLYEEVEKARHLIEQYHLGWRTSTGRSRIS